MNILIKFITSLSRFWDPRPFIAKEWLASAQAYENNLRSNQTLKPELVEAILCERNRIHAHFQKLLPEHCDRISIVITRDYSENCFIGFWDNHVYVLVTVGLLARPIDHPNDCVVKGWEWLAHHEVAHLRKGHLPYFFHTRRLFRFSLIIFAIIAFTPYMAYALCLLGASWILQTIVHLCFEWEADRTANNLIMEPSVIQDAEMLLFRMTTQTQKGLPFPLGYISYAWASIFNPHPPFAIRRYLFRRRLKKLLNPEAKRS